MAISYPGEGGASIRFCGICFLFYDKLVFWPARMQKSVPILLLMRPNLGYYRGVLRGIKSYANQSGNWVFAAAERTRELPRMLEAFRPAGALAFVYIDELPRKLQSLGIPVVSFANTHASLGLPRVGVDDVAVGKMAADYLLERGFRQLAFVGHARFNYSNQREKGFAQRLKETGLPYQHYYEHDIPDFSGVWNWKHNPPLWKWLKAQSRPTGIFAANDVIGLRLSESCRRMGLRIPEDIALLGVDNDDLCCFMAHQPLSSIEQPLERIGYEAARLLDRLIHGKSAPDKTILLPPVRVVSRRSSDIMAIADSDLAAAIRFMHDHAHRDINMTHVLKDVPMSRRSLERKCRQALGRSPADELQRIRIQRAKELLNSTDLPITKIATQAGFGAGKYLSTIFHKQTGMTPSAYRRQFQLRH